MSSGRGSPSVETSGTVIYYVSRKHGSLGIYDILSLSIQPAGFSVQRADRNEELSKKKKGGDVCFMIINYSWCDCDNIQKLKSFCSPDLEYHKIKC